MITAIIIEDEKRNARLLNELIKEVSQQVEVVAIEHFIDDGLKAIQELQPDLVFLDIKMPQGTGFDLLDQLPEINFDIIFTTAFDNFAIQAIKFSALDYILKPIDKEELDLSIQKALTKRRGIHQHDNMELLLNNLRWKNNGMVPLEKIALPTLKGYQFVLVNDIVYCEADGTYCKIHLVDKAIFLVSRNLKELEGLLFEHHFFRIHRSFLINMNHAKEYIKGDGGQVLLSNNSLIPVSQRRRESFVKKLLKE